MSPHRRQRRRPARAWSGAEVDALQPGDEELSASTIWYRLVERLAREFRAPHLAELPCEAWAAQIACQLLVDTRAPLWVLHGAAALVVELGAWAGWCVCDDGHDWLATWTPELGTVLVPDHGPDLEAMLTGRGRAGLLPGDRFLSPWPWFVEARDPLVRPDVDQGHVWRAVMRLHAQETVPAWSHTRYGPLDAHAQAVVDGMAAAWRDRCVDWIADDVRDLDAMIAALSAP